MNSKTLFYILKRIGLAILTIWVVITITFFVMHAVPGGPFVGEKATTPAVQAAMEAKYGLDKPVGEQYVTYLKDIVTKFDFGPSLKQRGRQVVDIIKDGMKVSAKLGVIAAFGAAIVGIILGAIAALQRNKFIDKVIMVITTAFVSMPSFIMGSLLLIIFAVSLQLLPANGAAKNGLIVPVIRDAQELSLLQVSERSSQLVAKAREGKLMPNEYSGGTFTISNMGMYGIDQFDAVVNPPEAAILAVSATIDKPVVIKRENGEKAIEIRPMMNVTLSADHRVVDGVDAGLFVKTLKEILEEPIQILM